MSPDTQRLGVAAGGGAFVGVVLTVLAVKLFGGPSAPGGAHGRAPDLPVSERSKAQAAPVGTTLTVSTPGPRHYPARLRVARSQTAKVVSHVPTGTTVKVIDSAADATGHRWYHVAVGGQSGWMHGDVLT